VGLIGQAAQASPNPIEDPLDGLARDWRDHQGQDVDPFEWSDWQGRLLTAQTRNAYISLQKNGLICRNHDKPPFLRPSIPLLLFFL
jgi:hypothetical protein